jgi:hypothetical protein
MLLTIGFSGPIYAQAESKPSVIIDNVSVTLGAPEEDVLGALSKDHQVTSGGDVAPAGYSGPRGNEWTVSSRNGPPWKIYGEVLFAKGKVVYAGASTTDSNDKAAIEFARGLILALSTMVNQSGPLCTVKVLNLEGPKLENKSADIQCGSRHVSIGVGISHDSSISSGASVGEDIGPAPDSPSDPPAKGERKP